MKIDGLNSSLIEVIQRAVSNVAQNLRPLSVTVGLGRLREQTFSMAFAPHPVVAGIRSQCALLAASLRNLLKVERHDGDFASQRICPFCSLITPRHESSCLECGKAFRTA
jgi:hypothetical protein